MHAILILVAGVGLVIGLLIGYNVGRVDHTEPRPLQIPSPGSPETQQQRHHEEMLTRQRESPWYAVGWLYGMGLPNPCPTFYNHVEYQLGFIEARQELERRRARL